MFLLVLPRLVLVLEVLQLLPLLVLLLLDNDREPEMLEKLL